MKIIKYWVFGCLLLLTGCTERPRMIGDLVRETDITKEHRYEVVYSEDKTKEIKSVRAVFDPKYKSVWFYDKSGEIKEVYYEVESVKEID